MEAFELGKKYSRRAIQEALKFPEPKRGGDWNTVTRNTPELFISFATLVHLDGPATITGILGKEKNSFGPQKLVRTRANLK